MSRRIILGTGSWTRPSRLSS